MSGHLDVECCSMNWEVEATGLECELSCVVD